MNAQPKQATPEPHAPSREEALAQLSAGFKGTMATIRRLRGRETHWRVELTFAQYLLFGLAERNELSTRELALAADLAPATVTQMLDRLAAMGLVERTLRPRPACCDRALTTRGRELITRRRADYEQRWQKAPRRVQRRGARNRSRGHRPVASTGRRP
jgi:DNA-binding MarR family transcriptional regulator